MEIMMIFKEDLCIHIWMKPWQNISFLQGIKYIIVTLPQRVQKCENEKEIGAFYASRF